MSIDFCFLIYNRFKDVLRCFHSLAFSLQEPGVRWLIWDNGSRDTGLTNFLSELARRYPNVEVFLSAKNEGVAGGRVQLFRRTQADLVASLDSDIVVQYPERFKQALWGYPWGMEGLGVIGDGGHFLTAGWMPIPARRDYDGAVHVLAGYSHIFPRALLDHISVDIEMNFFGAEDDQFCLATQEQGYFVRQIPLGILHRYGGTWDTSRYYENRRKLYRKHHELFQFEPATPDDPRVSLAAPLVRLAK